MRFLLVLFALILGSVAANDMDDGDTGNVLSIEDAAILQQKLKEAQIQNKKKDLQIKYADKLIEDYEEEIEELEKQNKDLLILLEKYKNLLDEEVQSSERDFKDQEQATDILVAKYRHLLSDPKITDVDEAARAELTRLMQENNDLKQKLNETENQNEALAEQVTSLIAKLDDKEKTPTTVQVQLPPTTIVDTRLVYETVASVGPSVHTTTNDAETMSQWKSTAALFFFAVAALVSSTFI